MEGSRSGHRTPWLQRRRHDADHQEFLRHTIHAYGFSEKLADQKSLTKLFSHYGVVAGVQVVKVAGSVNSWAIINFSNHSARDSIIAECKENTSAANLTSDDQFIILEFLLNDIANDL